MEYAITTYGSDKDGLVCGYLFAPDTAGRPIEAEAAAAWLEAKTDGSFLWLHFNTSNAAAERWIAYDTKDPVGLAELFVGGEGLRRGAEPVLATLLHEAAHGVAHVRGIKDTSRQGRYHNTRFKLLGEELGLTISQAPTIGWSSTELAPGTAVEYVEEIEALASAIVALPATFDRFTRNVSFGSLRLSPLTCTVTALAVSPGAKVTVPLVAA